MNDKVQDILEQNTTLWVIQTKGWPGTEKLIPEDLNIQDVDVDEIFKLGRKDLIPYEWRVKLNRPRTKITYGMEKVIKAKRHIVSSIWAVPNSKLEITDKWIQAVIQEQKDVVEEFISQYEDVKNQMINNHSSLTEECYPTVDKIRNEYKIIPFVFQTSATKIDKADPQDLIAIKEKYAEKYENNIRELTDVYVNKAHEQIIEVCRDITNRIMDGGKKVTKTTLKKPLELVKEYEAIASLFDDEKIKSEVNALKALVSSTSADQIRRKGPVSEKFAEAIASIGKNIGDLSGVSENGRVKRKLNLDNVESITPESLALGSLQN